MMPKLISILLVLCCAASFAQGTDAPEWLQERFQAPHVPVRAMAEWEEQQGVMMSWVRDGYSIAFRENLLSILCTLQEHTPVFLMCNDADAIEDTLVARNIPLHNIHFFPVDSLFTVWTRDYGPQSIYLQPDETLALVDWLYDRKTLRGDDISPYYLAYYLYLTLFKTMSPPHTLKLSGANFMTDGHGTAFLNTHYRDFMPDKPEKEYDDTFRTFMGIDRAIKLDIGYKHLDFYFKLLDEETLLMEEYPAYAAEKQKVAMRSLQYIEKNFKSCYDRPFKIITVPLPEVNPNLTVQTYNEDDHAYSYINSLIVNDVVFVPTYNCATDETALQIYRDAMPGYAVIGIDCSNIAEKRGGVHCLVRDIGALEPIYMSHAPLLDQSADQEGYTVRAVINNKVDIARARVFWKTTDMAAYEKLNMTEIEDHIFATTIPQQPSGTTIEYYISATNENGKEVNKPFVAPRGVWSFAVSSDAPKQDEEEPLWILRYKKKRDQAYEQQASAPTIERENIEKIRLSQIVVRSENTLRLIIEKLQQGEAFEELAIRYSIDYFSGPKGGDLGEFKRGELDPEIEQLIVRLKVGESCTVPLRTQAGFHIFKRTG